MPTVILTKKNVWLYKRNSLITISTKTLNISYKPIIKESLNSSKTCADWPDFIVLIIDLQVKFHKSLTYTPRLYMYHCERIILNDPKRHTGYSWMEISKPYTFSPEARSLKLLLSPNSYLLFLFVRIYIFRIRFYIAWYLILNNLMKSPSLRMYLLVLHLERYWPGKGRWFFALAYWSS